MEKFIQIVMGWNEASGKQVSDKEHYGMNPIRVMQKRGYTCEVWTLKKPNQKDYELLNALPIRRFSSTWELLKALKKDKQVKLVLANLRPFLPALLSPFTGKKCILLPHTYELGSNALIRKVSLFCMKRFKKIIALTPFEKEIYEKNGIAKENITLLPHAIDVTFFSATEKANKEAVRNLYDLNEDNFIITSVSNFRKFKNVDTIIEAFGIFQHKHPKARLLIVGANQFNNPRYKDQSARRFKDVQNPEDTVRKLKLADKVIFTGSLNYKQVRNIFAITNLFVNNSDPETMGISVYEAAAAAIPLCLSDIGSFTSVFKDHALYSPPRSKELLAVTFEQYKNDKTLMQQKGKAVQKLMNNYDYEIFIKRLEQFYNELLVK
ncbi:MAG: glycosyltransferase family 4 protein [Nanoarchaeota archaeon]|nr:glycosyltransferase family 4 protein [Nanoarchaeota archaeon]